VAHEQHAVFSAGEPGDPTKPARIINVKGSWMGSYLLARASKFAEESKSALSWRTTTLMTTSCACDGGGELKSRRAHEEISRHES
jgi:hypothetical protein